MTTAALILLILSGAFLVYFLVLVGLGIALMRRSDVQNVTIGFLPLILSVIFGILAVLVA